ncbi:MAG TPA: sensor domain-containing diguanylate cyclase [Kofleriaceae bacterium]|nr:sensor domain-containing diguanylate cyclase [Kofleriaceae bacterium]
MASDDSQDSVEIDRRRSRHEHEWELFQLIEHVPVAVLVVTGAGKPYYANAHARALLGMRTVPDHANRFCEVYQAFEIGSDRPYPIERLPLVRALAGERCEISDIELRHRGVPIPVHASGAPITRGNAIAFAIMALQDVRELRRIATSDALTGLPNRTALAEAFARERWQAERGRYSLSLALIDFDRFKSINDNHRHATGDLVLRRSSDAIVQALRPTDIVGRWGGEELLVLLPDAELEQASHEIERALAAVRALEFPVIGTTLRVTFSAGVVEAHAGESLDHVAERADVALYQAKHAGRNRVVTL